MRPDDPNANKRASYVEQAARAEAADNQQPEQHDASVVRKTSHSAPTGSVDHRSVEHRSGAAHASGEPARADNTVTGDQPPLYGAAAHADDEGQRDDTAPSGGSSTGW